MLGPPQKPWAAKGFCGFSAVGNACVAPGLVFIIDPAAFRISFLTVCYRGSLKAVEAHWVGSPDPEAQVQGCGLAILPSPTLSQHHPCIPSPRRLQP